MENESENGANQIASESPGITIAYNVIPENDPFPVEWLSFDAKQMSNSLIQLDWETANETNNSHFDIERSTDNLLYSKVGEVRGSGTIDYGQRYEFTDSVIRAKRYYYRLRQVDMDGQFEYSDVREVEFTDMDLVNLQVYPNPAYDWIYIEGQIDGQEVKDMIITDMTGRVLYQKNMTDRSNFKFDVDLSRFTPGIYNITVLDGYGQSVSSNRFIKK